MLVKYPLNINGKLEMLIYKSHSLSESKGNSMLSPYSTKTEITQNYKFLNKVQSFRGLLKELTIFFSISI